MYSATCLIYETHMRHLFTSHLDVDECELGQDRCEQDCMNTYGGYSCHCSRPGHVIDTDGLKCRGKCSLKSQSMVPTSIHVIMILKTRCLPVVFCFHIVVERQCRNLTQDDAPSNGGLVCHWYTEHSSQFCQVMCNNGFVLPSGTSNYETCGPTTNYTWSFQVIDRDGTLLPCVCK